MAPDFLTITAVREQLRVNDKPPTWYRLALYRKRGVLPPADMIVNGRELWKASKLPVLQGAVTAYEQAIVVAQRNELQVQRQADREAEEARVSRVHAIGEMYQRRAEKEVRTCP